MAARLPRLVEWLVQHGLLRDLEAELGDILEEYSEKRAWWLWLQIFSLLTRPKTTPVVRERKAEMFSSLLSDVRYGMRSLSNNPGFTAAAVLTIALGIGINTGIFSIFNGIALRPLPVPASDRLLTIYQEFR